MYDADGNVLTASNTDGSGTYTYTYAYDALDRMTSQTDIWGITLSFGYDAANNLTSETDSLGGTVTNTYNADNQIIKKQFTDTSSHALSVAYSYDVAGELTQLKRYSDATTTTLIGITSYGYDDAGRTSLISHKYASGTSFDALAYTYNAAGQVANQTSSGGGSNVTLTYDNAGEVTGDGTHTYKFDAEGNRNSTGYTTTTGNELTADANWTYSYDAAGEMTQKVSKGSAGVWLYGYDNASRLVEADHKPSTSGAIDETVTYKYDVLNNRIGETINHIGGSTTTLRFAYDPISNCWADLTGTGALTARRLYNDAVDLLLARIDGGGVEWYETDLLGSVRDIIGSGGSLLDHREYGVWGNLVNETSPTYGDRYGWTGRDFDVETSLQYNRARWYDPTTGRWTTQDTLGYDAGDSNLYRYVTNRPSCDTDPAGTQPPNFNAPPPKGWVVQPGKTGQQPGAKGTFSWKIELNPRQDARVRAEFWFAPSNDNRAQHIVFVQAVQESTVGGNGWYGYEDQAKTSKLATHLLAFLKTLSTNQNLANHIDIGESTNQFYGVGPIRRIADLSENSNVGSGLRGRSAYMVDMPSVAARARKGQGDVIVRMETAALSVDSWEVLGVITWGFRIKDQANSPIEILNGGIMDFGLSATDSFKALVRQANLSNEIKIKVQQPDRSVINLGGTSALPPDLNN
jgi:RHS repeat-associated protein